MKVGQPPAMGCESCEPSTSAGASPSAPRPVARIAEWLEGFHEGSFSRAEAREASAEFIGCGLRADGGGGTYLLLDQGGEWQVAGYANGATQCDTLTFKSGRQALICSGAYYQGNSIEWSITEWEWLGATARSQVLLQVDSTQSLAVEVCEYPNSGPILDLAAPSLRIVDLDGDGLRDVRIELDYAMLTRDSLAKLSGLPTFADACACTAATEPGAPVRARPCPGLALPSRHHARLDFIVRDEHLRATLGSERLVQAITQPRQFR